MKAVYQSTQAYLSLSYYEVNNYALAMSDGGYDNRGRYIKPQVVGSCVAIPNTLGLKNYTFMEGEKHNQITLTDPTEIRNMRAYIKRRGENDTLIREVLFEGNEADLEELVPVEEVKQEEPVKKASVSKQSDDDELSDWDRKLLKNMISR